MPTRLLTRAKASPVSKAAALRRWLLVVAIAITLALGVTPQVVRAQWQPTGLLPTRASLHDVLRASARATRSANAGPAQRHEQWTYVVGQRRISVTVAVRDADYRTSLELDGLVYMAGRVNGNHWRADGNGIVHGVEADLQGDPLDRAPQAVFGIDPTTCTLAGEARLPAPAWVLHSRPDGDKAVFLYVDESSGTIVREVMRDGRRVVTTNLDRFEPIDGTLRARHWHIEDGSAGNVLDATVDTIEPGAVSAADVAFPKQRVFTAATPLAASVDLAASFVDNQIRLQVDVGGAPRWFDLDTGTTSITVDPQIANRFGGATLEHAVLPRLAVGPLLLEHASVLTVPFGGNGILGDDFFFGHVVEIDYLRRRVRVLSADDARAAFADRKTMLLPANVDQGLPLVSAALGPARSNSFAIDTGSAHLYVMKPFMSQFATEVAQHWTPAGRPSIEHYLEGGIEVQPYRVADFHLGGAYARNLIVGGQIATNETDDLDIPFDGIIGTDILQAFDVYVDYDNRRIGLRR